MKETAVFEQSNFKTYDDAKNWLAEEKERRFPSYENMSFEKLFNVIESNINNHKAKAAFVVNFRELKQQMYHTLVYKEGG